MPETYVRQTWRDRPHLWTNKQGIGQPAGIHPLLPLLHPPDSLERLHYPHVHLLVEMRTNLLQTW